MNNLIIGAIPYAASAALLNNLGAPFLPNVIASAVVAVATTVVIVKVWGPIL